MSSPSFTVLTVSKRTGWFEIALRSIVGQTVKPQEWIIVAEDVTEYSDRHYDGWKQTVIKAPEKIRVSNLSASENAGLRLIDTDYVIFYQDFIELPKDCFEKLLNLADERTFVTTCTPNYDGSDDGRYTGVGSPRACRPEEWESNVAIAPMNVLRALGGFNEEYDNGWAWDNVNVSQRAAMLGCRFIIDESNRPKLYPHEQEDKKTMPLNAAYHQKVIREIREGKRPIKNPYL